MTENEKIEAAIEKYWSVFQATDADVAQTRKGAWIFFEYDERHKDYHSFFRFSTALQLERIIAGLAAEELNILIETTAGETLEELGEADINSAAQQGYDGNMAKLLKNMEILSNGLKDSALILDAISQAMLGTGKGVGGEEPCGCQAFMGEAVEGKTVTTDEGRGGKAMDFRNIDIYDLPKWFSNVMQEVDIQCGEVLQSSVSYNKITDELHHILGENEFISKLVVGEGMEEPLELTAEEVKALSRVFSLEEDRARAENIQMYLLGGGHIFKLLRALGGI